MSGRVAFYTLGCKVNQYDMVAMQEVFRRAGYEVVGHDESPDVFVVNTCAVTARSEQKARQAIRRFRRGNPAALIALGGCYAQVAPEAAAALPEVDLVFGIGERGQLVELVQGLRRRDAHPVCLVGDVEDLQRFDEAWIADWNERARAVLKVQEGCRQFCAYCIVPFARGPQRSRPLAEAVAEAQRLVRAGYREIVVAGVHLGAYEGGLVALLRALAGIEGLWRIRLSSLEPMDIEPELFALLGSGDRFCPHLHLPLQSGSDDVLRRMRRPYDTAYFARLVETARRHIPDLAITTDVLVGFPGESEEDFRATYDFSRQIGFSRLHVFTYSRRPGTAAAAMPGQLPNSVKKERSKLLMKLGEELAEDFHRRYLGRVLSVLVEERQGGYVTGYSPNYIRVRAKADRDINTLVPVRITHVTSAGAAGELAE